MKSLLGPRKEDGEEEKNPASKNGKNAKKI